MAVKNATKLTLRQYMKPYTKFRYFLPDVHLSFAELAEHKRRITSL